MNRVYLEVKSGHVGLNEHERIIPILNLNNKNNRNIKDCKDKSLELSVIIDKQIKNRGYLELNTYNVRMFLGIESNIVQDLAIEIINKYLEKSNIERCGGFITIWKVKEKSIEKLLKVSDTEYSVGGYCTMCETEHARMRLRFKSLNTVECRCTVYNKWTVYNVVSE